MGRHRAAERLALAAVLCLALWLRLDGLDFGLDLHEPRNAIFTNHADSRGMVIVVRQNFLRGDLDPGVFFLRGPGSYLLYGIVDAVVLGARSLQHPQGW